ncbi:hypothetical protein DUNSADRAFT_1997, partial [Dunaliella salina]
WIVYTHCRFADVPSLTTSSRPTHFCLTVEAVITTLERMLQLNSGQPCAFRKTHVRSDMLRPRRAYRGRRLQLTAHSSPRDALEALFLKDTAPGFEEERPAVQQGSPTFASPFIDWSLYYIQILFVGRDHDDPRARLACAIFERISSW